MKKELLKLTILASSLFAFYSMPVLAESQSPTTISSEGTISFDWTDFTPLPGLPEEEPEGEEPDEENLGCQNQGNDLTSCPPECSGGTECPETTNQERPQLPNCPEGNSLEEQLGGGWTEISKERPNTQHVLTGNLPQTGETSELLNIGFLLVTMASGMLYVNYKL